MNDFDCKRTFPHAGTLVFHIFSCSRGRERSFLLFFLVPACGKPHFFRFCLFPGAGTSFFLKSGCSRGRERGVFLSVHHLLHLLIDDERDNNRRNPTRISFWAKRNIPFIPYPHTGVRITPFRAGLIRPLVIPTISSDSIDCFF